MSKRWLRIFHGDPPASSEPNALKRVEHLADDLQSVVDQARKQLAKRSQGPGAPPHGKRSA